MKQSRFLFLLLMVLSGFLFLRVTCDSPPKNCPSHYFSEEFEQYVMFEPGSYWIYMDTVTGLVDSLSLLSQSTYFKDVCDRAFDKGDVITQEFYSSIFFDYDSTLFADYKAFVLIQSVNLYVPFLHDYWPDHTDYIKRIDSLKVFDTTYRDLILESFHSVNNQEDIEYYWDRNHGAVFKTFYDYKTDSIYHLGLLRSHVIKSK